MSYKVRYTKAAREDLRRLYDFLLHRDINAAKRARIAIGKAMELLEEFPFTCRKTSSEASGESAFLRELIIPFGAYGYVALFEIENQDTVTILAIRHQREDDFH